MQESLPSLLPNNTRQLEPNTAQKLSVPIAFMVSATLGLSGCSGNTTSYASDGYEFNDSSANSAPPPEPPHHERRSGTTVVYEWQYCTPKTLSPSDGIEADSKGCPSVTDRDDGTTFLAGAMVNPLFYPSGADDDKGVAGDLFLMCIASDGTLSNIHTYGDFFGSSHADIGGIAFSKDGNPLITGSFEHTLKIGDIALSSTGGKDFFLAEIARDGKPVWARSYGSSLDDAPRALSVDEDGNIVLAGFFTGNSLHFPGLEPLNADGKVDTFLVYMDQNGNPKNVLQIDNSQYVVPEALAINSNVVSLGVTFLGDIPIEESILQPPQTARNHEAIGSTYQGALIHLDSTSLEPLSGSVQVGEEKNDGTKVYSIAYDPDGFLYSTLLSNGKSPSGLSRLNTIITKSDPSKKEIWKKILHGPTSHQWASIGVHLGQPLVFGNFDTISLNNDYVFDNYALFIEDALTGERVSLIQPNGYGMGRVGFIASLDAETGMIPSTVSEFKKSPLIDIVRGYFFSYTTVTGASLDQNQWLHTTGSFINSVRPDPQSMLLDGMFSSRHTQHLETNLEGFQK